MRSENTKMKNKEVTVREAAAKSLSACFRHGKYSNLEISSALEKYQFEGADRGYEIKDFLTVSLGFAQGNDLFAYKQATLIMGDADGGNIRRIHVFTDVIQ